MKEQNTQAMKVFTIKITNDITGRFDLMECPTKADRTMIAGQYISALSKSPDFIHCITFPTQAICSFKSGKRVVLNFGERNA